MPTPTILAETDYYLVLNKPAAWLSERHPRDPQSAEAWAADYLLQQKLQGLPPRQHYDRPPKPPFLGVVHRLDRVTSGLLVFAKKKSALRLLNEAWRERRIQKTYLALVEQAPPAEAATVEQYLLKLPQERRAVVSAQPAPKHQVARLSYRHLGQNAHGHCLQIELHTGRFHQIRAQLAHLGCPIVGDQHYGAQQPYQPHCIGLHAWRLAWADPETGEGLMHQAPLPATDLWSGFEEHWSIK